MTFPGESLAIHEGYEIVGGVPDDTLGASIIYRGGQDGAASSRSFDAGDEWAVWVSPFPAYLSEPDVVAVLSWVVVVDEGTVTVTAGEGLDPDSGSDPFFGASTSLGSFTLTPGTNVIPSTITWETLVATFDDLMLRMTATAGAAVVSQVKLRAWPPGGAVGGWAVGDPYDVDGGTPAARHVVQDTAASGEDYEAGDQESAFDLAANALASTAPGLMEVDPVAFTNPTPDFATVQVTVSSVRPALEVNYFGNFFAFVTGTIVHRSDPYEIAREEAWQNGIGLDAAWPPDEVPGDWGTELLGVPTAEWGDATVTTTQLLDQDGDTTSPPDGMPTITTVGAPDEAWDDRTGLEFGTVSAVPIGLPTVPVTVGLPDTPTVLLGLTHSAITSPMSFPPGFTGPTVEVQASADILFDPVTYHLPAYRYWSPSAVTRPLRQFHRDDGMGVTPPRAFGGASRIRTGRAFGYD